MSALLEPVDVRDRVPVDPPEGTELAAANDRARELSLSLLEDLAPGIDVRGALQRSDGGTFQARLAPIDVRRLLDPDELLDEMLTRADLDEHRVKLMKDRERIDAELVLDRSASGVGPRRAPGSRLAAVLDEGHTLVLDGLDRRHTALRRLAEHVSRTYQAPVNINGYVSFRPHPSFGAHWDDHEVMILQLIGHKRWVVFEPVELSPQSPRTDQSSHGRQVFDEVVEPGSFLSLPRGWGHDVTGLDRLTFHLTITVPRMVTTELLRATLLRPSPGLDGLTPIVPTTASPADVAASLRSVVAAALDDERVDSVVAAIRANLAACRTQRPTALVDALSGRTPRTAMWVRSTAPGGVLLDRDDPGVLMFARQAARVDPSALAALAPLLDGHCHLAASADDAAVDAALTVGLLEVVDEPGAWGLVAAG